MLSSFLSPLPWLRGGHMFKLADLQGGGLLDQDQTFKSKK